MQDFHLNETTTVTAPLMTHTGQYQYLRDQVNLAWSQRGGGDGPV